MPEQNSPAPPIPDPQELERRLKTIAMLKATGLGGIKTAEDLRERMLEYITYMMDEGYPTKLQTLNKRFGVISSKLQMPARDVVSLLVSLQKLEAVHLDGGTIILTTPFMREFEAHWTAEQTSKRDPHGAARQQALRNIWNNAK